ncbi:MAG: hypothetical protein KDK91_04185, partial [Gammaproteobacteria bacterium]|nr:hypothetical protein [Gammaproteobacteria bacterium]
MPLELTDEPLSERSGDTPADAAELSPLEPPLPRKRGTRTRWLGLYGSARAMAIARAAQRHDGLVVVVTADTPSATDLEQALGFFLGHARDTRDTAVDETDEAMPDQTESSSDGSVPPLYHFPDWETLAYDNFSPHQDIISERLSVLARLPHLQRGVIVVPVSTLMTRVAPRSYLAGAGFELRVGARLDQDQLRLSLESAGYRCVTQVMEHGEFAIRGSLIDLFPMGDRRPYRLDLFDDEIES